MKVSYDPRTDTLSVILKENASIVESDEDKPGVILDYDEGGNLVSLEILDASQRVTETRKVEFQAASLQSDLRQILEELRLGLRGKVRIE